jgi:hypothetical protein
VPAGDSLEYAPAAGGAFKTAPLSDARLICGAGARCGEAADPWLGFWGVGRLTGITVSKGSPPGEICRIHQNFIPSQRDTVIFFIAWCRLNWFSLAIYLLRGGAK